MSKIKISPFVAADHLDSEETIAAYLAEAQEDGNPELLRIVLADIEVARARLSNSRGAESSSK